jgi:methylmalonyl-CoA/ethylmalonyl-CoA epimerase
MTEPRTAQGETVAKPDPRTATFHHVGYAVKSIAGIAKEFAAALGAEWNGEIIYDPLQEAKVTFMFWGSPQRPAFELVEPAGDNSPLHRFLAKGGGLHHVCYEVDFLDVKQPLPAVAFGGRRIAWVYTPQKLLVEYLER